ncbi:hypothetical protein VEE53_37290 [Escherichia coli]|nr:hypothetical protein VEE53_37290 [Escherichia coli]
MNIEKSRLISEAAPHLNAYQGTINGNEFADQKEAFNLAGMLSKVDIYNLTKPDIDTAAPGVPLPVREALTLNKKMVRPNSRTHDPRPQWAGSRYDRFSHSTKR